MSMASGPEGHELVVAGDGSIPAEQITRLGVRPGTHLRVVAEQRSGARDSIAGRLASWPDLPWGYFEQGSRLARADLDPS